jgi:hypothetical protein
MVTMRILPYQGKISMVEPGIEPRDLMIAVGHADH